MKYIYSPFLHLLLSSSAREPTVSPEIVVPLVRKYIEENYRTYAEGELTLKHLKRHLVKTMNTGHGLDDLRRDENSQVIEDEVDAITERCKNGKEPATCVHPGEREDL